ncbi:hypothetical protein MBANPS3_009558 [Mucor bainieri]
MTRGEIEHLPETLFSQQTKKQFSRVLGFDLGSSALSCSYSTDDTPAVATVLDWPNGKKSEPLFPACIQYKDWSTTRNNAERKAGFEGLPERTPIEDDDFYIESIKEHVIQWIQQGAQDNQPDAILVLSDFFEAARIRLEDAFRKFNEKLDKAQEQKQKDCEELKSVNAADISLGTTPATAKRYSLDDCRFTFAVPDDLACKSEYINLVRTAFEQADFLKPEADANRLIFVTDAVAAGYSCVHAPQSSSGIELYTNYLVVDLGSDSTKLAIIQAERTAATSSVLPATYETTVAGYHSFNSNFRKYITERSDAFNLDVTQLEEVDLFVDAFEMYRKTNKIDLDDDAGEIELPVNDMPVVIGNRDLREHVFQPYLDDVFDLVFKYCQIHRVAEIFLRGQHCQEPYFDKACKDFISDKKDDFLRKPKCSVWGDQPEHMVSNGAVSYGLRSAKAQIPMFDPVSQANNSSKAHEAKESSTSSKKFCEKLPKGYFAVGIDFGTTFSGCSYSDLSQRKPDGKRTIETISSWDRAYTYQKVSTTLKFNEGSGKFSKTWGYDVAKKKMSKGDLKLEYFKLLLSPENVEKFYGNGNREIKDVQDQFFMFDLNSSDSNTPPKSTKALTPVDIIAKYLEKLNGKIKTHLSEKSGVKEESLRIKYVITVPAMWTDTGRATMIKAAIKAGLVESNEDKCIQLITEPEAAALSCDKFMKDTLKLNSEFHKQGLVFTVFDAGGGTVDLVTFQQTIVETKDGEERSIKQIGEGTGDTCGAAYLETRFRQAIVDFYTETMGIRVKGEGFFEHHVEYFKKEIKDNFMPSSRPDAVYKIKLPPLPVIPQDTKPKKRKESVYLEGLKPRCRLIENNTVFEISVAEVKRCIFDPVVDRAVKVLKAHLEKPDQKLPSAILMVGGFSQSKYLQHKIQVFCSDKGIPHVSAPPEGVTAISRGAVSYFLEPRLVSEKIASNSYAMCVDLAGRENNTSHLCYFVQKGDTIHVDEKLYTKTVSVKYPESAVVALFAHNELPVDDSTKSKDTYLYTSNEKKTIKKVAEYVIDLPDSLSLSPGTKVDLEVCFRSAIGSISLDIKSKDDRIGLQTSRQNTEECISFKKIEMDALNINLIAKAGSGLGQLFAGIFSSKSR